ncbi:MAG: methyltransferase domain-containing protein [Provencibacterium sp.]|nr:methyltransferase domain-containing protein [Provencibacterium sp.]
MSKLNRISFDSLKEGYIRSLLTEGMEEPQQTGVQERVQLQQTVSMSAQDAQEYVLTHSGPLKRTAIRLAYRFKGIIRRLPFLGDAAVQIKNRMLNEVMAEHNRSLDLSPLLGLDNERFLEELYKVALGRTVDTGGFQSFRRQLYMGLPKEAAVFIVCTSAEFAGKYRIKDLSAYRRIYRRYRLKHAIKRIPVLNWLIALYRLPFHFQSFTADMRMVQADQRFLEESRWQQQTAYRQLEEERWQQYAAYRQLDEEHRQQQTAHRKLEEEHWQRQAAYRQLEEERWEQKELQWNQLSKAWSIQEKQLQQQIQSIAELYILLKTHQDSTKELLSVFNSLCSQLSSQIQDCSSALQATGNRIQGLESDQIALNQTLQAVAGNASSALESCKEIQQLLHYQVPDTLESDGIMGRSSYLEASKTVDDPGTESLSDWDKFFYHFGNLFRGTQDFVRKSQEHYCQIAEDASQETGGLPFLDIGCGRGEFLKLLQERGIQAVGLDLNLTYLEYAKQAGLHVESTDALSYLESAADESLCGISMFQVAEHLKFDYLFQLCYKAYEKTGEGGCLIIETINPYCYKRLGNFSIDPSHILFPSPDALKLLLEMVGYSDIKLRFYAPLPNAVWNDLPFSNYEGFCIIGKKGKNVLPK